MNNKIIGAHFDSNETTRNIEYDSDYSLNAIVTIEELPNLKNLITLSFNNIDFSEGLPPELFYCYNLLELTCTNCDIKEIPYLISELTKLEKVDFSNNDLGEFPYSLLELGYLTEINLEGNYISELIDDVDYRNIQIYMKDQYIEKIPLNGYQNIDVNAKYANVEAIKKYHIFNIGPTREWIENNSAKLKRCCADAITYTKRGDRIINSCLRKDKLPIQLESFYKSLINARNAMNPIPTPLLLFRGIDEKVVKNLSIGSTILDKGFSSFSFSVLTAENFSTSVIIWDIPKNFKLRGISFDYNTETSFYENEEEILIGPGLSLIIKNITNTEDITYYEVTFDKFVDIDQTLDREINTTFITTDIFDIMKNNPTEGILINDRFFLNNSLSDFQLYYDMFLKTGINSFLGKIPSGIFTDYMAFFISLLNAQDNTYYLVKGDILRLINNNPIDSQIVVKLPDGFVIYSNNYTPQELYKYISTRHLEKWMLNDITFSVQYIPFTIS